MKCTVRHLLPRSARAHAHRTGRPSGRPARRASTAWPPSPPTSSTTRRTRRARSSSTPTCRSRRKDYPAILDRQDGALQLGHRRRGPRGDHPRGRPPARPHLREGLLPPRGPVQAQARHPRELRPCLRPRRRARPHQRRDPLRQGLQQPGPSTTSRAATRSTTRTARPSSWSTPPTSSARSSTRARPSWGPVFFLLEYAPAGHARRADEEPAARLRRREEVPPAHPVMGGGPSRWRPRNP